MSKSTAAKIDNTALYVAMYGADWATRGVVTESTGCTAVEEWVGDRTGARRAYKRTRQEHTWNREVTACTRCGERY